MGVVLNTKEKEQVKVCYVNTPVPCTVEENFNGHLHDHEDLTLAEVLQDQESVFQSFQAKLQNDMDKISSHTAVRNDHVHGESEEELSLTRMINEAHVALDEDLARELQEIENQLAVTLINENTETESSDSRSQSSRVNVEGNSSNMSPQGARQNNVNPDNMTYEELQSLGEAIGTECRGLSDELISFLPSSTYKTGLFSKKEKQECVICCMAYKNRDKLITLPCQHQYHKFCIIQWLKINKACPICNEDVFGS